jgi:hypothetical protein
MFPHPVSVPAPPALVMSCPADQHAIVHVFRFVLLLCCANIRDSSWAA